ncbi:MAG: TetR/AcrR family transcriptional regulator C-terminal domain-containing protein [Faecousia sp.]
MADSNITKRALAVALKELMEEKPFAKISVADICEKCNMNRKSFYYHFRDKYDLVNWIFDTEFICVIRRQGASANWDLLEALADYFYDNRNFYRKALRVEGQNSFSEHFHELLFNALQARMYELLGPGNASDFQVNFLCDASAMTLRRWIMDKDCMPPEEFLSQLKTCLQYIADRYASEGPEGIL